MEELILIAPAFNIMGVRAREISTEPREQWKRTGSMSWDDDPVHSDWPVVLEVGGGKEAFWRRTLPPRRPVKAAILHALQDDAIRPSGSRQFLEHIIAHDPVYPIEALFDSGDHRLSAPEHLGLFRRLVRREA